MKTCSCDLQYLVQGEQIEIIKSFLKNHPFMTGLMFGLAEQGKGEEIIKAIKEVVDENYRKPNGWGK